MNTGDINELRAMQYYQAKGCQIFTPLGGDKGTDFIAVDNGEAHFIQVKTVGTRKYKDVIYSMAALRKSDGSAYNAKEVDVFFVVGPKVSYEIPADAIPEGSKCIMLDANTKGYKPRHGLDVSEWEVSL